MLNFKKSMVPGKRRLTSGSDHLSKSTKAIKVHKGNRKYHLQVIHHHEITQVFAHAFLFMYMLQDLFFYTILKSCYS